MLLMARHRQDMSHPVCEGISHTSEGWIMFTCQTAAGSLKNEMARVTQTEAQS